MGRLKIEYGIDLGTTNSGIARIENGVAQILEIDNSKSLPSAVLYDRRGKVRVGISAKNNPDSYLEMKRDMGKKKIDGDPDAKTPDGKAITPETLSSEVLKKLAERVNDEVLKSVVITVPALFQIGQIEATKRSAKMAGFEQIEILQEPVAAATAFGMQNIGSTGKWVVFDFGGGTFDSSLLEVEEGLMKVLASEGDNMLGGGDLDRAIINNLMLPKLKEEYNIDGLDEKNRKTFDTSLKLAADLIKIETSMSGECDFATSLMQFREDADGKEIDFEYIFKQEEVHKLCIPYFQKAIDCVKTLLKRKQLTIDDIDELILVGGPTQISSFRKMIEEQLKTPNTSVDPMSGIAIGASIFASNIKNEIKNHGDKIGEEGPDKDDDVQVEELMLEYEANTVLDKEPVSILKKNQKKKLFAILEKSDGSFKTPKQELDDVFLCNLTEGINNFKIQVFDENSDLVNCNISEFNIVHGIGNPETSLSNYIGIEIFDKKRKRHIFRFLQGLKIDNPLPAVGLSKPSGELYTGNQVRPGVEDDKITIKLYQANGNAEGTRSKLNKYSGLKFVISGNDVPKLIPENSVIYITVNIDHSQNVSFTAEFPDLDVVINLPDVLIESQRNTSSEEVEDLLEEANKIIENLSSSFPIPDSLEDLKNKRDFIKKDWEDNNLAEQTFNNLKELVLKLDKKLDDLEWPKLEENIRKSLQDLETLVNECVEKKLKGYEQDKSDLDSFKTNFEQLKPLENLDLGQSLLDNINGKNYQIMDRHAGKEQTIAYIRSINNDFNSIKWKNTSQAKSEVDKGMQMVSFGSSESELKQQLSRIFSQMLDPADIGGGGIKG
jgi:molecular chaperone DnaK